jgi:epoxyqueuosine reductase
VSDKSNTKELSMRIKTEAIRLGFAACGISKADYLKDDAQQLKTYLEKEYHGKMGYMANHFDKRTDPRLLVENAKSVISVLFNYYPKEKQNDKAAPIISKYAYGKDYHYVIKEKLKELLAFIKKINPETEGRAFVDSAPVMERAWAREAGLGWIGKHGLLINKQIGSFVFIGELIINTGLIYDTPIKEYCGTCTRCIDACPTNAIIADKTIDARKCISYLTIELKGTIPQEFTGKLQNRVFGCDICQDVCPHNSKSVAHNHEELKPIQELLEMRKIDWFALDKSKFNKIFKNSPVKRTGFKGLRRNLDFISEAN